VQDRLIYLASPYSHHDPDVRAARALAVAKVAGDLMGKGHLIFSPVCHTHLICETRGLPFEFTFWERHDRAILKACKALWVVQLPGYKESQGIWAEKACAMDSGIPIMYVCPHCCYFSAVDATCQCPSSTTTKPTLNL